VGFFGVGFLGGCTQKTHWVFWVRTRVSEPWKNVEFVATPAARKCHQEFPRFRSRFRFGNHGFGSRTLLTL